MSKRAGNKKPDQVVDVFKSIEDFNAKLSITFKTLHKSPVETLAMATKAKIGENRAGEKVWFGHYIKKSTPIKCIKNDRTIMCQLIEYLPGNLTFNSLKLAMPMSEHPDLLEMLQKKFEAVYKDEKMEKKEGSYEIRDFKKMNHDNSNINNNKFQESKVGKKRKRKEPIEKEDDDEDEEEDGEADSDDEDDDKE